MKQEVPQYNAFNIIRKLLWICGIYSGKYFQPKKLHYLRAKLTFLLLSSFILVMILKMITDSNNLEVVFQLSYHVMAAVNGEIKVFCLYRALPQFNILEEILQSSIFHHQASTPSKFIMEGVNGYKIFEKIFLRISSFCAAVYSIMPFIDGKLRVPIWYPDESFKIYFLIYEIVCIWITIATILCTDLFIAGLIHIMSAQMKALNYNLRNVTERNPDDDLSIQEKMLQDNLKRCIRHHLEISDFISKLQGIFSFGLFSQILGSIVAISSGGVYVVTVSLSPSSFLSLVSSITVTSLQIAMYCWVGQGLITESEQIRESCYLSEWYTCSVSTKKIFFIIMERSKKVISFKAGNVFVFSFATFIMIMKNAYSYFTVLVTAIK